MSSASAASQPRLDGAGGAIDEQRRADLDDDAAELVEPGRRALQAASGGLRHGAHSTARGAVGLRVGGVDLFEDCAQRLADIDVGRR